MNSRINENVFKGPNNDRAQRNLAYYERSLKELKMQLAGDNPTATTTNENAVQVKSADPFVLKNPRPPHVLGYERDVYEALCRGDYPQVRLF